MLTYVIATLVVSALFGGATLLVRRLLHTFRENSRLVAQDEKTLAENEVLREQNEMLTDHSDPGAAERLRNGEF